jgi:hypothetical protein
MEDLLNPLWWQEFFSRLLFFVKVVSGVISFIMFLMVVHLARKTGWWEDQQKYASYRKLPQGKKAEATNKMTAEWERIKTRLMAGDEANSKLAVIEADKLVDTVIKDMGIEGDTMGERMKKLSPATLPSIQDLWEVHKLRNNVVHTADFHITIAQATRAIAMYEKVLKDLKAI